MLTVKIRLPNPAKFERDVLTTVIKIINQSIRDVKPKMVQEIKSITRTFLTRSKFFQAVVSSDLSGEFGIPSGEERDRMADIINQVVEDIDLIIVPLQRRAATVSGNFNIGIGKDSWENVINLPAAKILTEKGAVLEWMRWVLTEGDKIIINDFEVEFKAGAGRSGLAHMMENSGQYWKVPTNFSGTIEDNWITREVNKNFFVYRRIIEKLFKRRLSQFIK
jgi:hypothetical protein